MSFQKSSQSSFQKPFQVPPDLEEWCVSAEQALSTDVQAAATLRDRAERSAREDDARHAAERPDRVAAGHVISRWLEFLADSGAFDRVVLSGASCVPLFGPYTRTGRDTSRHSGARWYVLATVGAPALVEIFRTGPAWGRKTRLATADEIAECIPTAICHRIAADVASGAVWDSLRSALLNRRSA